MKEELTGKILGALIAANTENLNSEEKNTLFKYMCRRYDLDEATVPFRYLKFGTSPEQLYTTASCAKQLGDRLKVSLSVMARREHDGYCEVEVMAKAGDRLDFALGTQPFVKFDRNKKAWVPLSIPEKCNALKKAETQAKRRALLSICGVALPDETEAADIAAEDTARTIAVDDSKADELNELLFGEGK